MAVEVNEGGGSGYTRCTYRVAMTNIDGER